MITTDNLIIDHRFGHQLPPALRNQEVIYPHPMHLCILFHSWVRFAECINETIGEEIGEVGTFTESAARDLLLAFLLVEDGVAVLHELREDFGVFKFVNIDLSMGNVEVSGDDDWLLAVFLQFFKISMEVHIPLSQSIRQSLQQVTRTWHIYRNQHKMLKLHRYSPSL